MCGVSSGPPTQKLVHLHLADRRARAERELDRALEVRRHVDVAAVAVDRGLDAGERGGGCRRPAAERAEKLPARLEQPGAGGQEEELQHRASLLAPGVRQRVGPHEAAARSSTLATSSTRRVTSPGEAPRCSRSARNASSRSRPPGASAGRARGGGTTTPSTSARSYRLKASSIRRRPIRPSVTGTATRPAAPRGSAQMSYVSRLPPLRAWSSSRTRSCASGPVR